MFIPRALGTGSSSSGHASLSTWIPVAVVLGILAVLSIIVCSRKTYRARIMSLGRGAGGGAAATTARREITAEQLVGSINHAPGAPPRRPRRPRRTPSQISTVSLPAYMKEPGEQELVVTRGPDGEDVPMPTASVDEEEEDESNEDHEGGAAPRRSTLDNSRYTDMPHPPHDSPLLGTDVQDLRGEAPAYSEEYPPGIGSPGISVAPPQAELSPSVQRRSGFFAMFRPAPLVVPVPPTDEPLSLTHTRTRSTTRLGASSPEPTASRHRPSTSTSTLFSLRRNKSVTSLSGANLTSPSMISLASISAPLSHTLVKTEFSALPRGGLTPDQLKMISGTKEGGLAKFGMPFGDAATAYASSSRLDLDLEGVPPPAWEDPLPVAGLSVEDDAEEVALTVPSRTESRPESRASDMSLQTFATAEQPDTPAATTSDHAQESTDATVRPA